MAGIKGMKGKNLGGARKNTGPKPKVQQTTELALSQEEVLTNTIARLHKVRDTTLASLAVQLDCSFEDLVKVMRDSPEMLPPSFHALELKYAKLQGMLDKCKLLPSAPQHLLLAIDKQVAALS